MFVESDSETNTQERSVSSASIFITSSTIRRKTLNPYIAFFFLIQRSCKMKKSCFRYDQDKTLLQSFTKKQHFGLSLHVLIYRVASRYVFGLFTAKWTLNHKDYLMLLSRTALWSHLIGTESWSSINKSLRCWVSSTKIISLCRLIWKLPWFPLQKVFGIYQLDFGLLKKISSVIHSHIDELHRWWGKKKTRAKV